MYAGGRHNIEESTLDHSHTRDGQQSRCVKPCDQLQFKLCVSHWQVVVLVFHHPFVPSPKYITLLHLLLLDYGQNPHSDWNFWNSRVFHLHIFFLIICNSDLTRDEIYPQNPQNPRNPHTLASAFSSCINWNLHSRLLPPCECCHHCTVTHDCQLTTTIHNDTACPPIPPTTPSHLSPL